MASASRKRRWLRLLAAMLVSLALIIALLPTALGARWIYQPLIARLAAEDFQLHVGGVQLRWLSALKLTGVQLRQQGGPALISIDEVKTDRGLLGYLLGGRRLGRIEFLRPTVDVQLLKEGSNLERFVHAIDSLAKPSDRSERRRPAIDIEVLVRGLAAEVRRQSNDEPLVVVPPLDLHVTYRAAQEDSRLVVAPTLLLDRVELTPELIELGLGHAVPLLANSAWFDGRVSLSVDTIDIPLDTPERATGKAQLTLHQVRSGPNNPSIIKVLDFIARLREREPQHELVFVDGSQVLLAMADSRISHSGLRMGLPKIDSRLQLATSGSVGVEDRSLDLVIEVPVPIAQLARREQVQELGVPMLRLPIGGTLDKPDVRWDAMRGDAGQLLGLLQEKVADDSPATAAVLGALGDLAEGKADETIAGAVEVLQQLRERRRQAAEQSQADAPDGAQEQKKPSMREALRNLLRGNRNE